jgi:hypothetical protein
MRDLGGNLGSRTKYIGKLIYDSCIAKGANNDQAKKCSEKIEKIFIKNASEEDSGEKSDTLLFLSDAEIELITTPL